MAGGSALKAKDRTWQWLKVGGWLCWKTGKTLKDSFFCFCFWRNVEGGNLFHRLTTTYTHKRDRHTHTDTNTDAATDAHEETDPDTDTDTDTETNIRAHTLLGRGGEGAGMWEWEVSCTHRNTTHRGRSGENEIVLFSQRSAFKSNTMLCVG